MKVAILGGSGFMGYDLVRRMLREERGTPVVYSTSAKSLVNLARHDVEIRLVSWPALAASCLDDDVDFVVNYAHPFGPRDGLSPERQCGLLTGFLARALTERPRVRLVHVSTMSVYEPFAPGRAFRESDAIRPPRGDVYARNKWRVERTLRAHPQAAERLLVLRPTVVYGPFCRPWTDAPLAAFRGGDVSAADLSGCIQPLFVSDVTDFVLARLASFEPGVVNLPGPQSVRWSDFLGHFAAIAGAGRLVEGGPAETGEARSPWRNLRTLLGVCAREQAFKDLVRPLAGRLPATLVERAKRQIEVLAERGEVSTAKVGSRPFARSFFADDRLVSGATLAERFGAAPATRLAETREVLERYYRYRFGDGALG